MALGWAPRSVPITLAGRRWPTSTALADIFWIGGTKAGTLFGEAIVIPNSSLADDFDYHIKQRGALLAKGRSLGVQFQALFSDGLFERSAVSHANVAAQTLAAGVVSAGFELAAETESNQVFALLPNPAIEVTAAVVQLLRMGTTYR